MKHFVLAEPGQYTAKFQTVYRSSYCEQLYQPEPSILPNIYVENFWFKFEFSNPEPKLNLTHSIDYSFKLRNVEIYWMKYPRLIKFNLS